MPTIFARGAIFTHSTFVPLTTALVLYIISPVIGILYVRARSTSRSGQRFVLRARKELQSCNFYILASAAFSIVCKIFIAPNALFSCVCKKFSNRVNFTRYEKWNSFVFNNLRLAARLQLAIAFRHTGYGQKRRLTARRPDVDGQQCSKRAE